MYSKKYIHKTIKGSRHAHLLFLRFRLQESAVHTKMESYMQEALAEARKALEKGEVPVGCVFVLNDSIVARGSNYVNVTRNATRHAEFMCIDQVLDYCKENDLDHREYFPQLTVVVTVEPCIMCSVVLHTLRVKGIVFGCTNDRFGGKSVVDVAQIVGKNLAMTGGVCADEAMDLLKEFYKSTNPSAPVPAKKC